MIARLFVGLGAVGIGCLIVAALHHLNVRRSRRLDLPDHLRNGGHL